MLTVASARKGVCWLVTTPPRPVHSPLHRNLVGVAHSNARAWASPCRFAAGADVLLWSRSGPLVNQHLSRAAPATPPFIYNTSPPFDSAYRRAHLSHTPSLALTVSDYAIITCHSPRIDPSLAAAADTSAGPSAHSTTNPRPSDGATQWTPRYVLSLVTRHSAASTRRTPSTPAILTRWCVRCSRCASASPRPPPRPTSRSPCHGRWQKSAPAPPGGTRPATTRAQE